jgi:hypothetical protein
MNRVAKPSCMKDLFAAAYLACLFEIPLNFLFLMPDAGCLGAFQTW